MKVIVFSEYGSPEVLRLDDVRLLKESFEAGKLKSIIDKRFPLAE